MSRTYGFWPVATATLSKTDAGLDQVGQPGSVTTIYLLRRGQLGDLQIAELLDCGATVAVLAEDTADAQALNRFVNAWPPETGRRH